MPFFNLTRLGVQDPIKSSLKETESNGSDVLKPQQKQNSRNGADRAQSTCSSSSSILKDAPCGIKPEKSNSEAQGSYVKYTERLTKHQRTENGI